MRCSGCSSYQRNPARNAGCPKVLVPGIPAGGEARRTPEPRRSGRCRCASRFGAVPCDCFGAFSAAGLTGLCMQRWVPSGDEGSRSTKTPRRKRCPMRIPTTRDASTDPEGEAPMLTLTSAFLGSRGNQPPSPKPLQPASSFSLAEDWGLQGHRVCPCLSGSELGRTSPAISSPVPCLIQEKTLVLPSRHIY